MHNWKKTFFPKEGYWIRKSADGEMLLWLCSVNGIWTAKVKDGSPAGFTFSNGLCHADNGVQFKGPYIF